MDVIDRRLKVNLFSTTTASIICFVVVKILVIKFHLDRSLEDWSGRFCWRFSNWFSNPYSCSCKRNVDENKEKTGSLFEWYQLSNRTTSEACYLLGFCVTLSSSSSSSSFSSSSSLLRPSLFLTRTRVLCLISSLSLSSIFVLTVVVWTSIGTSSRISFSTFSSVTFSSSEFACLLNLGIILRMYAKRILVSWLLLHNFSWE